MLPCWWRERPWVLIYCLTEKRGESAGLLQGGAAGPSSIDATVSLPRLRGPGKRLLSSDRQGERCLRIKESRRGREGECANYHGKCSLKERLFSMGCWQTDAWGGAETACCHPSDHRMRPQHRMDQRPWQWGLGTESGHRVALKTVCRDKSRTHFEQVSFWL